MPDPGEAERQKRLYDDLRLKLLDLSRRNPMLNYKHRAGSRRQLRIVDADLETVLSALVDLQKELVIEPLPELDNIPEDERTDAFVLALGHARSTDIEYLTRLMGLEAVAREDEATVADLDRWVRDRVREQLGLQPRPDRESLNIIDHARKHGINPSYELPQKRAEGAQRTNRLKTLHFADELDSLLARIASDARLAEQETGLSTLFLALGFLRWFEAPTSDVANFAPLLLLPVELKKRMEGRRAIYCITTTAEQPEINLSLRELLLHDSPDVSRKLPEFDEENDGVEAYLSKVRDSIDGLNRWRVERNLTLGLFAFGRLAMHQDLSPDNWNDHPIESALLHNLLQGSQLESSDNLFFASNYDIDDEKIENVAPILINDADASQHSAIVDVMQEKNLVIEGPPGTGKSQTITNIIANALYAGKTVLFLAEKLAALQVVKDRLDAAGLGDFCFELHSDKAHPKSIVDSLRRRHEMNQDRREEPPWQNDLQRLRSTRGRMREYLSDLHEPEGDDSRTAFQLFWAAIATRRELAREFEAVRRADLTDTFRRNHEDIDRCSEGLKLFSIANNNFAERHGVYTESPWTTAGLDATLDCDSSQIGDVIRDTYSVARQLSHHLVATSRELGIELPERPSAIIEWIELVRHLPLVPENSSLPLLSSFKPTEVAAAAELAEAHLDLEKVAEAGLQNIDPKYILIVAQQAKDAGLAAISPLEINAHLESMQKVKAQLLDGLSFLTSVVSVFEPNAMPTVAMADGVAKAVLFAKSIPPDIDKFLDFDRETVAGTLAVGYQRQKAIAASERTLRSKFKLSGDAEWPSPYELRNVAEVLAASGIRKAAFAINGRRRRAGRVVRRLHIEFDASTIKSDIEAVCAHVDSRLQFCADNHLASAAAPHWAELNTPLRELVAAVQLRAEFDRQVAGLGDVHRTLKSYLFSPNRKFIEALRSYQVRAEKFLRAKAAWPESISDVPLAKAQSIIDARVYSLTGLSERIKQYGLSEVEISSDRMVIDAQRRINLKTLEEQIASDPVLGGGDKQFWLSESGCQALRQTAALVRTIVSSVPPGALRDRLFSEGGAKFCKSLFSAAIGLGSIIATYRTDVRRLVASVGSNFMSEDEGVPQVVALIEPCLPAVQSLSEWCEVARRRAALCADGLEPLLTAFDEAELPPDRLSETFNSLVFHYRAVRARQRAALKSVSSLDLENDRRKFVAADESLKKRQREAVRAKLLGNEIPLGSGVGHKRDWTELHFLRNEFLKQARHAPIRRLLMRAGRATTAMKPCFMMSPLSLAKFLPSSATTFDLLVIDEASQMKPEDALGGLLRAKQAIIVGDPNQLPPTDFFSRVAPTDDVPVLAADEEPDDIEAESILDWSLKTYSAPRRLKWHYRSQCESLIAFSNKEFYASKSGSPGDLITFPSPKPGAFSVDLIRVNGNYKASRNPSEVARIVEAAIDFMVRHADSPPADVPTLGIVAINIQQKEAIREEFNRSARDEAVERYLTACNAGTPKRGPEPFFIKNLENVQGDERDIILISLTYGPEAGQTRVMQRFGPIARTQCHRRLNVLFTRARRRVVVFSSMGSDDVIVTPTSRRGVRVLRDYLRYAESRRLEVGEVTGRDFDSDFEREVKSRLEAHNFTVDPQVGVAGYRIDLGVRHPNQPTVYLAGIECDGAAFHSAKSARDRDRLRESVLRGLGWDIVRVWSTDWFADATLQTDRLVEKLRRLAEKPIVPDSSWVVVPDTGSTDATPGATGNSEFRPDPKETGAVVQQVGPIVSIPITPPELLRSDTSYGDGSLSDLDVRNALLQFRDEIIFKEYPGSEPERCILRDLMLKKILEARLDEPADFVTKIPLWLRERTDQRQVKFLKEICAIVERMP